MVVVTSTGYLLIDGKRYPVSVPEFRSLSLTLELPQLQAKRPYPPFLEGHITAFDGGVRKGDLDDEGNWYYDALGMEPTGPDLADTTLLKVGKQIVELGTNPAIVGLRSLVVFEGNLYALTCATTSATYRWNGTTWTVADNLPVGFGTIAVLYASNIVVFNNTNEDKSRSVDGTTWTDDNMGGSTGTGIWSAGVAYGSGAPRLYAAIDEQGAAGNPGRLVWTASIGTLAWNNGGELEERFSRSGRLAADGDNVYFGGADTTAGQNWGSIYKFDGLSLHVMAQVQDNYAVSSVFFQGRAFFGMQNRGELWVLDGSDFSLLRDFDTADKLSAMTVHQGALWLAFEDGQTADRVRLWRYDGESWSQPHYGSVGSTVVNCHSLVSYNDRLVVGLEAGSGDNAYEVSASSRQTAAQLELPNTVYGVPGMKKPFTSIALQHSALLSGQSVQGRWKLDDGAEATGGTNSEIGSTETVIPLPTGTLGARLRPKFYLTNGAAQDLTVYSARAVGLPPAGDKRVWEASLDLHKAAGTGGPNTSLNSFENLANLIELRKTGKFFQAVGLFTQSGQPTGAMQAVFDSTVPLEPVFHPVGRSTDHRITVPVRLVQALGAVNGLLDASFEQSAAGSAPNAAWTLIATPTSANVSTAVPAADGSKVLAVVFDGVDATGGREQAISGLTALRYYTVGGYIRRATTGGTVRIQVTGAGLDVGTPLLSSATDTEFVYYEVVFQLPSGTTAITIRLIGASTPAGTVYFDRIRLEE